MARSRSPLALSALAPVVALLALNGTATPAQAGLDLSVSINFGLGFDWCEPAPCHIAPVWDVWDDDVYCAPVTTITTCLPYDRWGSTYSYTYIAPSYRRWGWDDCDDWRWARPYNSRSGWSFGYSTWGGGGFAFSYSSGPSYRHGWGGWGARHWSRPAFYCPPPVVIYRPVVVHQPVIVQRPIVINQTPVVINSNPPIIRGSDRDRGGFVGPVAQGGRPIDASGQVVEVSTNGTSGINVDGSLPSSMDRRGRAKPNRDVAGSGEIKPVEIKPIEAKMPIESGRRPTGKPRPSGGVIDDRGNLTGPIAKPPVRDEAKPQRQPEVSKPIPSIFDKPQAVRPVEQVKPVESIKPGASRRPAHGNDFSVNDRPAADGMSKPSLPAGVREVNPVGPQVKPQPAAPSKPMPSVFDKPQEVPAAKPLVRTRDRQPQAWPQTQYQPQQPKLPQSFEQVGPRVVKPAVPQPTVDMGKPIRRSAPQPTMLPAQPEAKPQAQPGGKDKRQGK